MCINSEVTLLYTPRVEAHFGNHLVISPWEIPM